MDIKKLIFILLLSITNQIIYSQEESYFDDNMSDRKNYDIKYSYLIDIIPDEETAIQYADIILKKRYVNIKIENLKPYKIKLIDDGKVWEIKLPKYKDIKYKFYYNIRINKNTGEILDIWQDK